jgi:hypothetical protein
LPLLSFPPRIQNVRFGFLEETMNFDLSNPAASGSLKLKAPTHGVNNGRLSITPIEQNETPELRQMCAKVHSPDRPPRLATNLLDMSKRIHRSCCVWDAWPVPRKRSSVPVPWIKEPVML